MTAGRENREIREEKAKGKMSSSHNVIILLGAKSDSTEPMYFSTLYDFVGIFKRVIF